MGKVKAQISVSLDGYMAGPDQSEDNPLGEGGMELHQWAFKLASWRDSPDRKGGEGAVNPSDAVMDAAQANVGAVVMGRNMFGPVRGSWGDSSWNGWWGENPSYHVPVFVLTHHEREPVEMEGGTTFNFVTEGVESAMARAKEVAGNADISVGGGASTLHQSLRAGLLDEILVNQVPVLLGAGERLFDDLPADAAGFELVQLVEGREATHLTYRVT
jgi:dihydrofolate reductase